MMEISDIGLIGLAVMGENLALNLVHGLCLQPGSPGPGKRGNPFRGRAREGKAFPRDLYD